MVMRIDRGVSTKDAVGYITKKIQTNTQDLETQYDITEIKQKL